MFDLALNDVAILGAGTLLIVLGLGGLAPLLLAHRRSLTGRLRVDESLNPALSAATAFIRPRCPWSARRRPLSPPPTYRAP